MDVRTESAAGIETGALRWAWAGIGVLVGAVLIGAFVWVVDPGLSRPEVSGLVATLTLILTGALVGYRSPGETIRETAIMGLALLGIVTFVLIGVLGQPVPAGLVLLSVFYAPALAMAGGWVGEMMQGTLESSPTGRIDWAWVVVGVVVGLLLSVYTVFIADTLVGASTAGIVGALAASFLAMGFMVGWFSPGVTILEPALAAVGVVAFDVGLAVLNFGAAFPLQAVIVGVATGFAVALAGGWLGELAQRRIGRRAPGGMD